MLHTKFQGNQPSESGEEDVLKVFTIYGHSCYLGHMTWMKYIYDLSLFTWRLYRSYDLDEIYICSFPVYFEAVYET